MERLRLPARMKGGGMMSISDLRRPAFLGDLLDILPKCIDHKAENGEVTRGFYAKKLTEAIGEGTYQHARHRNTRFLYAQNIGPYPEAAGTTWAYLRSDVALSYGLNLTSTLEEWGQLGALAQPTMADAKNRGADTRKRGYYTTAPSLPRQRPTSPHVGQRREA